MIVGLMVESPCVEDWIFMEVVDVGWWGKVMYAFVEECDFVLVLVGF